MNTPLWSPTDKAIERSQMTAFMQFINEKHASHISTYQALHQWSIDHLADFWQAITEFCNINLTTPADVLSNETDMEHTQWFVDSTLNFAEHLLHKRDNDFALIFAGEDGQRSTLTYEELYAQVTQLAGYLKSIGVEAEDRVAGFVANTPEALIAMLATTSIGAVWSSCSPNFGLQGLLDRFGQITPKVLFATDEHFYKGDYFSHQDTIAQLQQQIPSLTHTVHIPYRERNAALENTIRFSNALQQATPDESFTPFPFDHPLYILYSSGTTGKPKCMVHGAGGTLLQHKKEHRLHVDLKPGERIFYYTTCGWMMWNWLVSALSVGATVVLYDGAAIHRRRDLLLDLADEFGINVFGVSAKYIEALPHTRKGKKHYLKNLRMILSTGSPLLPESYDYLYQRVKKNMCVSSITGGSDIVSLFGAGNPNLPVYRGEVQCLGLGMSVHVFNENGEAVIDEQGELVCTKPFPCRPIYFWNDPDGTKYHSAYYAQFPNVWTHGDFAILTEHGGLKMLGRSDATLNPGGVRIGTADIYNQLDKIPEVLEGLAVGHRFKNDERIVLFVLLEDKHTLSESLMRKIKHTIREGASPKHVPALIIQAPDLPRTLSGKVIELAVKKLIHGEAVQNIEAIANPKSLAFFKPL